MLGSFHCKLRKNMAVYTLKKTSDIEKKLKILRQQMYGKDSTRSSVFSLQPSDKTKKADSKRLMTESYFASDTTYLYKDLSKIGLLSFLAIGSQLVLFFLIKNHVLNLNF